MRQRDYNKYRKGWDRDKYNAEGYKDMTAYLALKRVEKEERGKPPSREVHSRCSGDNIVPRGECSVRAYKGEGAEESECSIRAYEGGKSAGGEKRESSIRAYERENVESWRRASEGPRRGRRCAKVRAGNRACREDERYCWEELANGIIIQAAQDWRAAMAILQEDPDDPEARETVRETESFFLSEYYATLTKVDGAWLLRRLKEEFPSVEVQPKYSEDDVVRRNECSIRAYKEGEAEGGVDN